APLHPARRPVGHADVAGQAVHLTRQERERRDGLLPDPHGPRRRGRHPGDGVGGRGAVTPPRSRARERHAVAAAAIRRSYLLRAAAKRAASRSVSAAGPKGARAATASSARRSRSVRAASMPSTSTSVALPLSASLAARLPSASVLASRSRMSSAIWKAAPRARP